jgi:RNA polymerase sigma-70 factor (sigma-E family)
MDIDGASALNQPWRPSGLDIAMLDRPVEGPQARAALIDHSIALVPFESFDSFVIANSKILLRCAFLIVGDAGAAEDVVQVALVKVSRRWGSIVANGAPLPYVRAAVVRTAISSRRRKWNGERPHGSLPERAGSDTIGAVDERDRLRRALGTLPPRQRAAVVLRHYLDLDEASAATALGCSVGTVKSQTAKGLIRLRAALDTEAPRALSGRGSRSTSHDDTSPTGAHDERR